MPHDLAALRILLEASFAKRKLDRDDKQALLEQMQTLPQEDLGYLRNRAFDMARELIAAGDEDAMSGFRWLEQVIRALGSQQEDNEHSTAHFSPGRDCRRSLIDLLLRCRETLDICVFTISDDRISEAIMAAYQRGVAVRIITDDEKSGDEGSDIARLAQAGIAIKDDRSSSHMHHKFALIDKRTLANGSFNWTRSASEYNQENLLITTEAALLEAFQEEFDKLWAAFPDW